MKAFLSVILFVFVSLSAVPAQPQEIVEAAKAGDLAKVKELVETDSHLIQVKDKDGRTPLHWAARGVHFEIIRCLVERGADINAMDDYSIRPLFSVVIRNHLQAAELLIKNGADLKVQNSEGFTALHFAAYNGFPEMAALLVGAGSDLKIKDQYGRTPLLEAISGSGVIQFRKARDLSNWIRIMKTLLETGAPLSQEKHKGFEELTLALVAGDPETVRLILDHGAEVPMRGEDCRRLLHGAASQGMKELTELMLEKGADPTGLNANGGTLLQSASLGGLSDVVRRMASLGMKPDQKDRYGTSPLHSAAAKGRTGTVRLLLDLGADINARTAGGETAFNLAREKNLQEVANLLAERGADVGPVRFPILKGEYLGQEKPGRAPKLFAPGIVSRQGGPHGAPVFTPDGKELIWFSWPGPVTQTTRLENGRWTRPEKAVNVRGNPTISPDGKRIYSFLATDQRGIAISEKTEDGWSEPRFFDSPINAMNAGWEIWTTRSGTVFFSSNRQGGKGGVDIYRAPMIDGRYTNFENLGENVNSEADDWGVCGGFAAPDESCVIFSSNRSGGYGGNDIYISFRKTDGTWTKAINLGPEINNNDMQLWPYVSPDGKFLFYINLEDRGNGEVFWVDAGILRDLRSQTSAPDHEP